MWASVPDLHQHQHLAPTHIQYHLLSSRTTYHHDSLQIYRRDLRTTFHIICQFQRKLTKQSIFAIGVEVVGTVVVVVVVVVGGAGVSCFDLPSLKSFCGGHSSSKAD